MKKIFCLLTGLTFVLSAALSVSYAQDTDTVRFRFASEEEARMLMGSEDVFTTGWSEFDIVSRLQDTSGTKSDLLALKQKEARGWSEEEKKLILSDMREINRIIRAEGYRLPLPSEVILVKSTMKDEGGAAGYTQANWIALSEAYIGRADEEARRYLLLHELSHILTRNSMEYKRRLYSALGFRIVPDGMVYPEELLKMRISNPDIASYDSYGTFKVNGRRENCAMYLYAERPYSGGKFFEYVKIAFVPYDAALEPRRDAEGNVIIYDMSEIEDFEKRVGRNTEYVIHPEEILAENFVLAFLRKPDVATPKLQKKVYKVLRGK